MGDYTMHLGGALNRNGVDVEVITSADWNLRDAFKVSRALREQSFDIVHIEYPTIGFGAKLGPQGLSLLQSCVVTIHEASQRHLLRKFALFPFAVRPEHIVFTSRFERRFAAAWAPWISRISSVIPVGSNIEAVDNALSRSLSEVVYFGLIAPRKGLEEVVTLSALIKSSGMSLVVRIIGKAPLKHVKYLQTLQSQTSESPVIWDLDLSEEQVAERLAGASVAYLPYPDGASERRTTLKAALLSGVAVITTQGPHTPSNLRGAVRFGQSAEEALGAIRYLLAHKEEMLSMARKAADFGKQYTWERIARSHLRVYQRVLSKRLSYEGIKVDNAKSATHVSTRS